MKNLQQLRELQQLYEDNIITDKELAEQKEIVMLLCVSFLKCMVLAFVSCVNVTLCASRNLSIIIQVT